MGAAERETLGKKIRNDKNAPKYHMCILQIKLVRTEKA